jgi:kanamycin kinase
VSPAGPPSSPVDVPALVRAFAERIDDVVWENEIGGYTFQQGNRFLKWNPSGNGVDLDDERARLAWARAVGHRVPEVLEFVRDDDAQLLVTRGMPGTGAAVGVWPERPADAVRAIAEGYRALHDRIPSAACPFRVPWVPDDHPPFDGGPVVVHGDACAPNTLIGADGRFAGHVDLGDLGVGDHWADLAVTTLSLEWNYGPGWEPSFYEAYGIEPDEERIGYYRAAWETFS